MERIAFVGAGMMGHGICVNVLAAGHPLAVIAHRNRAPVEDLEARGAREARTIPELVRDADVLMVCVNTADVVEAVVSEAAAHLMPGALVIDVTTSRPETTMKLARMLAARDIAFIDAPVVGGPAQAEQGKLGTLVGAGDDAFRRAEPILWRYSADVVRFGDVGSGITAKLLHNFLTVGMRQVIAQAFLAAREHAVDWEKLHRIMMQGAAGSRALDQMAGAAAKGDYRGNKFSIANCLKDMTYAGTLLSASPDAQAMQGAFVNAYQRLVDAGFGDRLASEILDPEVGAALARKSTT